MQRLYEITIVFSPQFAPEKREEIQKKLFKGMKITAPEDMGAISLAYPILKQTQGHFFRAKIEGTGAQVDELRNALRLTDGILRYLIIKN